MIGKSRVRVVIMGHNPNAFFTIYNSYIEFSQHASMPPQQPHQDHDIKWWAPLFELAKKYYNSKI
jgi:hypothetical protein